MSFSNMANVSSNSFTGRYAPGKQFSETFAIFEKDMSDYPILRPLIGWSRICSREKVCEKISSFWEGAHSSESDKEKIVNNNWSKKREKERERQTDREEEREREW